MDSPKKPLSNEEKLQALIEELGLEVYNLKRKVISLEDSNFFLEAEVLALGNLLIKQKMVQEEDLVNFTEVVLKQRIQERKQTEQELHIPFTSGEMNRISKEEEEEEEKE